MTSSSPTLQLGQIERMWLPHEVAQLFRVDPKTVTRWSKAGKLTAVRTLGGHRRFRESELRRVWEEYGAEWPF